jgi:RNase P/RNase MRP subunit p29
VVDVLILHEEIILSLGVVEHTQQVVVGLLFQVDMVTLHVVKYQLLQVVMVVVQQVVVLQLWAVSQMELQVDGLQQVVVLVTLHQEIIQ